MTDEFAINILEQYRENPTLINEIETVEEAVWLAEALDMAIKELESQRWIPCSERLPEKGEYIGDVAKYYLVQNEYGDMLVARYTHGEYWEQIYQLKPIGDEIVAWQPLPTPYKESDKNGQI